MSRVLLLIVVLIAFTIPANSVPPARAAAALSFSFANGTLAEDEALVRNGVKFAEEFFDAEFGITIDAPVTIDVRGTQQYDVIATGPRGDFDAPRARSAGTTHLPCANCKLSSTNTCT
ncbi:MAG: hypothetical protein R2845_07205 [Thermomicrobiales bacterium]